METSQEKKSLVAKLAEACNAVGGIEKKGTHPQYKYVKAADVAKAIRHELFERGIMLLANEQEPQWAEFTSFKGAVMEKCRLCVEYHITDGLETLVMKGWGVAFDSGDKAIYKAKTGALKYFLRGLGLIPDEKDDPEADDSVDNPLNQKSAVSYEEEFDQRTADQVRVKPFQVTAFLNSCAENGKTAPQIAAYLKARFGLVQVEELTRADFNEAIKWAAKNGDPANLESTLVLSKQAELEKKARKPAPVSGKQVSFEPKDFQ